MDSLKEGSQPCKELSNMKQTERWGRQPNCRSLGDCESASRSVSESTSEASKRKDESGQATQKG